MGTESADPFPVEDPQGAAAAQELRLKEGLQVVLYRLNKEAEDRVTKRRVVEKRWLDDLRQYYGEYDEETAKRLRESPGKSRIFVNQTRTKTNACEAKIADMLFPTDDRNWGIQPTPVPQLTAEAKTAAESAEKLVGLANQQNVPAPAPGEAPHAMVQQAGIHADRAAQLQAEFEEAKKRAAAMQDEMESQLDDCRYQVQSREMLQDAVRLGTGIMKGPVGNSGKARKKWSRGQDGSWALWYAESSQPAFYRVDPWSFFPDPDARTIAESDSNFERHLYSPSELRKLARQPGFSADAVRELLKSKPTGQLPTYLAEMRNITGENLAPQEPKYEVWEYRGPLAAEEIQQVSEFMARPDLTTAAGAEDVDPLTEIQIVMWFCQDQILKFGINHMDSGEGIYSVYNLEKDDSSIWGFGIPFWVRDTQKALNAAWRMVMDNAGLCTGPQIIINTKAVEPMDGEWSMVARKLWKLRNDAPPNSATIEMIDIPSNIEELMMIIKQAEQFLQDESNVTDQLMGDQGITVQTARGTAILANAANVTFRRMIKNFDDDMTTPNISRLYDWNMQFSDKEDIKGDMQVDARGSSVLLVRELQSQNLTTLLDKIPPEEIAKWIGTKGPNLLRKTVQSMMLSPDDVVESDEVIQQKEREEAQKPPPPPSPEQIRADTSIKVATIGAQSREEVAQINAGARQHATDTAANLTMQGHSLNAAEINSKQQDTNADRQSKERIVAAEAALTSAHGHGVPV